MKPKIYLLFLLLTTTTLVSAQDNVVTDKPNVPAKKETFAAKLQRYQTEGFKAAVVLSIAPLATYQQSTGSGPSMGGSSASKYISLDGTIALDDSDFTGLAQAFARQMNEAYNTDVFTVVELTDIPTRSTKMVGDVPDWGATVYKLVATYVINPVYQFDKISDEYTAKFLVNQNVPVAEYVTDKKGTKIKYIVRAGNLGFYTTTMNDNTQLAGLKKISELHTIVNPPMGTELAAELEKAMLEKFPDYQKKIK